MAIFGRTKKDTSQATSSKKEELSTATAKKITDGKAKVAQNNSSSNVRAVYNVTPRMVHIVTVPAKQKRSARTGGLGVKSGGKKAYVYLKKGETITVS